MLSLYQNKVDNATINLMFYPKNDKISSEICDKLANK